MLHASGGGSSPPGATKYGGVEELVYSVGLNLTAHIETVASSNLAIPTHAEVAKLVKAVGLDPTVNVRYICGFESRLLY